MIGSSLSLRIVGVLLLIALCVFPPLAYLNINKVRANLEHAFVEKAETIGRFLDSNIKSVGDLRDRQALLANIQKNIWLDADIVRIDLNLPENGVLKTAVSSDARRVGTTADETNNRSYDEDRLFHVIVNHQGERRLRLFTPIHIAKRQIGTYEIELTLEEVDAEMAEWIIVGSLGYAVVFSLFLASVFFFLKAFVIRRIVTVNDAVDRFAKGDLDFRLEVESRDEIGRLARAFNHMGIYMKKAGRHLHEANEFVDNIVRSMTDLVLVVSPNGKIIKANPAASTFLARSESELIGRRVHDVLSEAAGVFERIIADGGSKRASPMLDATCRDEHGNVIPISITGASMTDGEGQLTAVVLVGRDVRLAQQLISELRVANEQLQFEIKDRETKEKALRRSELEKARAEAANVAKGNFVAAMSHEIRTPMNGVLGMLDLLRRTELSERQAKLARTAYRSAETLLSVINDVLDFSKIEAGKFDLTHVSFDLREAVGDTIDLLAETAQKKGLEITYFVEDDLPTWITGDAVRLRQVLFNLIGNAVKFTEAGEVSLLVRSIGSDGVAARVRFEVRDTGIGIDEEARTRLFGAFEQADRSITRKFGGTGLGLSIAQELVRLMGGRIKVESAVGEGSNFSFDLTFPIDKEAPVLRSAALPPYPGKRALVVDDNATNREILQNYLNGWQMDVEVVEGGVQAIDALRAASSCGEPFDLAILDMVMPEMDGIETARAIKSGPKTYDVPILLLTSLIWDEDKAEAMASGIQAFLSKPARPTDLNRTIGVLLGEAVDIAEALGGETVGLATEKADAPSVATVLLAEDNPVNQEVALEHLRALNCRVDIVTNGLEAVAACGRRSYDLVLMDCQMPEMGGIQATEIIREREIERGERRHLPIVALTAHAFESERERCFAAGMDDHLSKPFKREHLENVLARWLKPAYLGPGRDRRRNPDADFAAQVQAPGEPEADIIDKETLNGIKSLQREGQPDVLAKIIGIYLESSAKLVQDMQMALRENDALALERAAHTLKSSSANLGARGLAELCKRLEKAARSNDLDAAAGLLAEIGDQHPEVCRALEIA